MLRSIQQNYHAQLCELHDKETKNLKIAAAGDGLGGKFNQTSKLKIMKFKEAMSGPDSNTWKKEIKNDCKRMVTNRVLEPLGKKDLSHEAEVMTLMWTCKKKKSWYILWPTEC